jgi:hypothetical protein
MRRSVLVFSVIIAFAIPGVLLAKSGKKSEVIHSTEHVTYNTRVAKVLDINYEKNTLALEGEGGMRFELEVDPTKVKNFKMIKKGDLVKVQTMESMALALDKAKKGEKPSADEMTVMTSAPKGTMPGMQQVETKQITAEVVKVDHENSMVELKGPKGNVLALKVKDPKKLELLKKGDLVSATYTVAMAISVERAPK